MHSPSAREKAVLLRKTGYSYSFISARTGISKSTLSGWLTEILYIPNKETVKSLGKARASATKRRAELRQQEMKEIRSNASSEIKSVTKRDILMFGLGLYMGEGAKTHGIVRVVNSDPRVISSSIKWFNLLGVNKGQFSPRIYLYPDSNVSKSLEYWSKVTGLPRSQFKKPYIDRRTDKKRKKFRTLPHGTLHLGVRSGGNREFGVRFSRRIQALNESVLEELMRD